jgi:hypothetical protein
MPALAGMTFLLLSAGAKLTQNKIDFERNIFKLVAV